jgi:hypothetical protein
MRNYRLINPDEEVSISSVAPWEGPCYIVSYLTKETPTDAFGLNFWFGGHDWLHGYLNGNASQHRFLPAANNTYSEIY